ncbi:MAG TPA: hypothetical protein EYH31_07205 [Anaerolineae bacterium]|nr:hypothetical protein [Anaerolineae bacterium]
MRFQSNEKLIRRRAKIGQYASLIGLGVLLAGMVLSFQARPNNPNSSRWIAISFLALAVGFIAANIGTYNLRRFGRSPRPDQAVAATLKGFDDRYRFYSWLLPANYVLLGPPGLFVFLARDQDGLIRCDGGRWRQPFSLGRLLTLFAQEGVGNPSKELREEIERLRGFIAANLPEAADVPIHGSVVFFNPKVRLELNNPDVPVLTTKQVKGFIRSRAKEQRLSAEQLRQLEQLFESAIEAK